MDIAAQPHLLPSLYLPMTEHHEQKLTVQRVRRNLIPANSGSCESGLKPFVSYFQVRRLAPYCDRIIISGRKATLGTQGAR